MLEEGGDAGLRLGRLPGVGEAGDGLLDDRLVDARPEAAGEALGGGDRAGRGGEVGRDLGLDGGVERLRRGDAGDEPEGARLLGVEERAPEKKTARARPSPMRAST